MSANWTSVNVRETDRIDVEHEYELCVWARYFNASEKRVKEAVAAVGDRAVKVREHLQSATRPADRPTAAA